MTDASIRKRTYSDVAATVASVVLEIAGKAPESELQPHWHLGAGYGFGKAPRATEELGLDAIDHVEIICAVEDALSINISDAAGNAIVTVEDLTKVAAECCNVERETA